MLGLWQYCRDSMGGYARLPDDGGVNDQSAWLMDAFNIIAAAVADLKEKP